MRIPTEQEWQLASETFSEDLSVSAGSDEWENVAAEYGIMAVGLGPRTWNLEKAPLETSSCIWEWCLNQYEDYELTEFDISKPDRAVRGGSFLVTEVKSAERFRGSLNILGRDVNIGFRTCIAKVRD